MASHPSARQRRAIYRKLLHRDGPWCHYCEVVFDSIVKKRMMTIDHVNPLSLDGSNDLSNLVLACSTCNSRKGSMSADEYYNSKECVERRRTVRSHVEKHNHASILFTNGGNWSCLCGAVGRKGDNPKSVECKLLRFGAFYEPSSIAS